MIQDYVAIDLETTGTNPATDKIIEIGAAKVVNGVIVDTYATFVNPQIPISYRISQITGIHDEDVCNAPVIAEVIADVLAYTEGMPLLGHNVSFDYSFLKKAAVNSKLTFEREAIDTLKIARRVVPDLEHKTLSYLCAHFGIDPGNSHRALDDAISAKKVYDVLHELNAQDSGFQQAVQMNYSVKRDTPITPAQTSYLTKLIQYHQITIEKPVNQFTKSEASRMIDRILSERGKIIY